MKHKLIILIGGPGCGKGTVAADLRTRHDFHYLETGALFRALPADDPVMQFIAAGNLVPDKELFNLLASKMDPARDTLLDGFPRTVAQAEWLVKNCAGKFDITVLYLEVPTDIMAARIQNRLSLGSGRADDKDTTAVQKRLAVFQTQTMPAIQSLRESDAVRFVDIDATPPIPEVLAQVRKATAGLLQ